ILDTFIDPGQLPQSDTSNDLGRSAAFRVDLAPPPSLQVEKVQAPAQAFSGQAMTLSWTVRNTGTGRTSESAWTDAVYVSPTQTLGADAQLLGTLTHSGALSPGAAYTATQTVTLPIGVSGSFYFLVRTDVNGEVIEQLIRPAPLATP